MNEVFTEPGSTGAAWKSRVEPVPEAGWVRGAPVGVGEGGSRHCRCGGLSGGRRCPPCGCREGSVPGCL